MKVLQAAERETTIRWDAEEKVAHIYTGDPVYIRKLDKLCENHPDEYKLVQRDEYGARYIGPARLIRFGKPASEARREAARRSSPFSHTEYTNTSELRTFGDSDE